MVNSQTRRDAKILIRNLSPRLCGKKFRDSKKVKTNHAKTRLRDWSKTLLIFRDPTKIFRDPRFLRYHSPPLIEHLSELQRVLGILTHFSWYSGCSLGIGDQRICNLQWKMLFCDYFLFRWGACFRIFSCNVILFSSY